MQTTSHFVGIELKSKTFSDLYIEIWKYLVEHNIENIISFQNILSLHITLYYFEKDILDSDIMNIQEYIKHIPIEQIFCDGFKYFNKDNKEFLIYFNPYSQQDFKRIRDEFHNLYQRNDILDNTFEFIPHITFFKVIDHNSYILHNEAIENIIKQEITKIKMKNIHGGKIFIYRVNSNFKEEIQIKL